MNKTIYATEKIFSLIFLTKSWRHWNENWRWKKEDLNLKQRIRLEGTFYWLLLALSNTKTFLADMEVLTAVNHTSVARFGTTTFDKLLSSPDDFLACITEGAAYMKKGKEGLQTLNAKDNWRRKNQRRRTASWQIGICCKQHLQQKQLRDEKFSKITDCQCQEKCASPVGQHGWRRSSISRNLPKLSKHLMITRKNRDHAKTGKNEQDRRMKQWRLCISWHQTFQPELLKNSKLFSR